MSSIDSVIEKVNKLRNLAGNTHSVAEANAAVNAANRLIEEYRLSEAQLETNVDSVSSDPIWEDPNPVIASGRVVTWRASLCSVLAKHYGCTYLIHTRRNALHKKEKQYNLIGRKSDIEIIQYMYTWLAIEIESLTKTESQNHNFDKSEGRIYAANYAYGIVLGIESQLLSSKKDAEKFASSTAIVKLNERLVEAKEHMKVLYPKLGSAPQRRMSFDGQARSSGIAKGKSIHLGKAIAGKSVKLLGK